VRQDYCCRSTTDAKTITLSDSDGNNLLKFTMQSGQIKMQAKTKVIAKLPRSSWLKAPAPARLRR